MGSDGEIEVDQDFDDENVGFVNPMLFPTHGKDEA
jgi:hypothetical protein